MKKRKYQTRVAGVEDAVSEAIGELTSLAEECRDIVDNASEGLAATQRIQTLDETASTLENYADEPECPAEFDVQITWEQMLPARKNRGLSRADRCASACTILSAAIEACDAKIDELDPDSASAQNDEPEPADESRVAEQLRDAIQEYRDELQQILDDAEGCEFPGMFG